MRKDPIGLGLKASVGLSKAKGGILGMHQGFVVTLPEDSSLTNQNVAVFGKGKQKMKEYAINTIYQASRRDESILVADPTGELHKHTKKFLESAGYKVVATVVQNGILGIPNTNELIMRKCACFLISKSASFSKRHSFIIDTLKYAVAVSGSVPNKRLRVPMTVILYNMPKIGAIPNLHQVVTESCGIGIKVSLIAESLHILMRQYPGGAWREMLDSFDTHLIMGDADTRTTSYIAKLIGGKRLATANACIVSRMPNGQWGYCYIGGFTSSLFRAYLEV